MDDPYNMYFTPDGRYAIVVAERLHRLDFRDAHTFALHHSLTVPCAGVDHMDFSADGRYLLASCEFSGMMLKVDVRASGSSTRSPLRGGAMPQDVKLSPDGKVFYVADMARTGSGRSTAANRVIGFLPTGSGVHGLYPSRDASFLYATNRGEGSISVISFGTQGSRRGGSPAAAARTWAASPPTARCCGSPGATAASSMRSRRATGTSWRRSASARGPHGLCVWPQPGRYSLGHTGILR